MDALADRLMRGPRGRRFLLELLALGDEHARQVVFHAAREFLDPETSFTFSWAADGSTAEERPLVTSAQAADALAGVGPVSPDPVSLLHALRETVNDAMYWQPPGADEVLASRSELDDVLARMARGVAESPAAAWLDARNALDDQHRVRWTETESSRGEPGTWELIRPAVDALAQWGVDVREEEATARRERPTDPRANWGGSWWSIPPLPLVTTTRALPGSGPVGLHLVEDSFGEDAAVTVRVTVSPSARVLEIACAEDWAELCHRHSVDVTASRRHDWFRCTGRNGDWVIPDWERVGAEYDGVHLTGAAYLEASRVPIPVDDGRASVIAGWNPDITFWLRDVTRPDYAETPWVWPDDGEWTRA